MTTAYDQQITVLINSFSLEEAVDQAQEYGGNLDFSEQSKEWADPDEPLPPWTYLGPREDIVTGAQGFEIALVRRAYVEEGRSSSSFAEYFPTTVRGNLAIWSHPTVPNSRSMDSYISAVARQEVLDQSLPAIETDSMPNLPAKWKACGELLTERFGLDWVRVHNNHWTWDRTKTALHCKTLVSACEQKTREASIERLGKYAYHTVICEMTALSTDRQCVPLLQLAWRETVLSKDLAAPAPSKPKPRF